MLVFFIALSRPDRTHTIRPLRKGQEQSTACKKSHGVHGALSLENVIKISATGCIFKADKEGRSAKVLCGPQIKQLSQVGMLIMQTKPQESFALLLSSTVFFMFSINTRYQTSSDIRLGFLFFHFVFFCRIHPYCNLPSLSPPPSPPLPPPFFLRSILSLQKRAGLLRISTEYGITWCYKTWHKPLIKTEWGNPVEES